MSIFENIFGTRKKHVVEPLHGQPLAQTRAEKDATRERMETEMAEQRERRAKRSATQP